MSNDALQTFSPSKKGYDDAVVIQDCFIRGLALLDTYSDEALNIFIGSMSKESAREAAAGELRAAAVMQNIVEFARYCKGSR